MDITKAEQITLDDALVAPANRLKIGRCNLRLSLDLKSREATLQVIYDVLKLTPFYKAFQASTDVPEIYMQEFWATASVHNREVPPKTKASVHKKKADSDTTPKEKPPTDPKGKRVKQTGDGVNILSKVPDEQVHKKTGIDEGAGDKPEVPDVPKHHSNSKEESWTFSDDDDDAHADEDDAANKESEADATRFRVKNSEEDKEGNVTNVALEGGDVDMTEADTTEETEDAHVTLTAATPVVQQQSSSVSDLVSKFISPTTNEGIDSILNPRTESTTLVNVSISVATETLAATTTIPLLFFPVTQSSQQTPTTTTTT
ncbi:hypothetical protein Tco_0921640 [Tanacetum coccineum]